jgi:hypothetical protein
MRNIKGSHFGPDSSVGKLNVSVQSAKHKTLKGAAVKSNYNFLFLYPIMCVISCIKWIHILYEITYCMNLFIVLLNKSFHVM